MSARRIAVVTIALVSVIAAASSEARGKKGPALEPGKYKSWGPDIDEVEIVKTFKAADYHTVAVMKVDTSQTPLPDAKEKAHESVKTVLASYGDLLVAALRDELKGKTIEPVTAQPKKKGILILRTKVIELDPGSRGARMMVGFGAGGTANAVSVELVDAASGDVLVRFTQRRKSGGTFKFAGGSDVQVMRDGIHAVGEDIAATILEFK